MLIPLEIGVANIVNLPHRKAEIYLKIQVIMNRHNLFIICILLLINISVNAQFSDDFSDGNFFSKAAERMVRFRNVSGPKVTGVKIFDSDIL